MASLISLLASVSALPISASAVFFLYAEPTWKNTSAKTAAVTIMAITRCSVVIAKHLPFP
jgi:hypothetical protein